MKTNKVMGPLWACLFGNKLLESKVSDFIAHTKRGMFDSIAPGPGDPA